MKAFSQTMAVRYAICFTTSAYDGRRLIVYRSRRQIINIDIVSIYYVIVLLGLPAVG
jgi:hypothetical protein